MALVNKHISIRKPPLRLGAIKDYLLVIVVNECGLRRADFFFEKRGCSISENPGTRCKACERVFFRGSLVLLLRLKLPREESGDLRIHFGARSCISGVAQARDGGLCAIDDGVTCA